MMKHSLSIWGLFFIGCSQTPQIHGQETTETPAKEATRVADDSSVAAAQPKAPEPKAEKCNKDLEYWTQCDEGRWLSNTLIDSINRLCFTSPELKKITEHEGRRWQQTLYSDVDPVSEWDYERCHIAGQCPEKMTNSRPPDMVPQEPVSGVTPAGANAYCRGLGQRLPTASEWAHLGGCGDNKANRILRCIDDMSPGNSSQGLQKRTYARRFADAVRTTYLSKVKAGRAQKRSDLCKRACRKDVSWLACDPHFADHYGHPPKKAATGFDVGETYKGNEQVEALLRGYAEAFPKITHLKAIGQSNQGRAIWALRISRQANTDASQPAVLLNAAHHGDELLSIEYAIDAIQFILSERERPQVRRWLDRLDIWVIPLVNPDGNHHTLFRSCKNNIGRKNGRDVNGDGRFVSGEGVDLNRNYPFKWGFLGEVGSKSDWRHHHYRGENPASEPETKALVKLAETYRFSTAFSWHTNGKLILSPYTIRKVKNTKPDLAWTAAEKLQSAMTQTKSLRFRVQKDMYPVDGVDQDWHFNRHGTLAYIIEGTHHNPQRLRTRKVSIETSRPLLSALLDYTLDAPQVSGRVIDAQNRPLQAVVMVEDVRVFEKEAWMSRQTDGRFDRFVPAAGTFRVRVSKPGFVTRTVEMTAGAQPVDVRLDSQAPDSSP